MLDDFMLIYNFMKVYIPSKPFRKKTTPTVYHSRYCQIFRDSKKVKKINILTLTIVLTIKTLPCYRFKNTIDNV